MCILLENCLLFLPIFKFGLFFFFPSFITFHKFGEKFHKWLRTATAITLVTWSRSDVSCTLFNCLVKIALFHELQLKDKYFSIGWVSECTSVNAGIQSLYWSVDGTGISGKIFAFYFSNQGEVLFSNTKEIYQCAKFLLKWRSFNPVMICGLKSCCCGFR